VLRYSILTVLSTTQSRKLPVENGQSHLSLTISTRCVMSWFFGVGRQQSLSSFLTFLSIYCRLLIWLRGRISIQPAQKPASIIRRSRNPAEPEVNPRRRPFKQKLKLVIVLSTVKHLIFDALEFLQFCV